MTRNVPFDLDTNAAVCKCSGNKKLNDQKHKCEETCEEDAECENGGTCGGKDGKKFCQCRSGVVGDTCKTVVVCESGIYKDCKDDAGTCSFDLDTNAAVCKCSDNKKLNDQKHKCEDCACGENEDCSFQSGVKTCSCKTGYAKDGGICKKTCEEDAECENGGTCGGKDGKKFCQCRSGVVGDTCKTVVVCKSGIYKDCKDDAGTCSFDLDTNAAVCKCSDNKKLNDQKHKCEDCACGENEDCSFKVV
ncbi:EGF-like domain-containing protein [Caerostris extrusa]|uniref:EGF-like domain-containing protein n=1 Tax=Caerostris extrusa TaxID=172846 RepID=A0AAV4XWH0_CAEEX|nr:EGF-like domain-containing protein [Caerostris extrusa]